MAQLTYEMRAKLGLRRAQLQPGQALLGLGGGVAGMREALLENAE
jgi:hypothetical protein